MNKRLALIAVGIGAVATLYVGAVLSFGTDDARLRSRAVGAIGGDGNAEGWDSLSFTDGFADLYVVEGDVPDLEAASDESGCEDGHEAIRVDIGTEESPAYLCAAPHADEGARIIHLGLAAESCPALDFTVCAEEEAVSVEGEAVDLAEADEGEVSVLCLYRADPGTCEGEPARHVETLAAGPDEDCYDEEAKVEAEDADLREPDFTLCTLHLSAAESADAAAAPDSSGGCSGDAPSAGSPPPARRPVASGPDDRNARSSGPTGYTCMAGSVGLGSGQWMGHGYSKNYTDPIQCAEHCDGTSGCTGFDLYTANQQADSCRLMRASTGIRSGGVRTVCTKDTSATLASGGSFAGVDFYTHFKLDNYGSEVPLDSCLTKEFDDVTGRQWSEVTWTAPTTGVFNVSMIQSTDGFGAWGSKAGKLKMQLQVDGAWVDAPGHTVDDTQYFAKPVPIRDWVESPDGITGIRLQTQLYGGYDKPSGRIAVCPEDAGDPLTDMVPTVTPAKIYGNWFSEERHCSPSNPCWHNNHWVKGWDSGAHSHIPISGVQCVGGYCDDKRAYFRTDSTVSTGGKNWLTEWFSEENNGQGTCPANHAITKITCSGSSCDNIQLTCTPLKAGVIEGSYKTGWVSEESGRNYADCGNELAIGMACKGSRCDDIQLTCGYAYPSRQFMLQELWRSAGCKTTIPLQVVQSLAGKSRSQAKAEIQLWRDSTALDRRNACQSDEQQQYSGNPGEADTKLGHWFSEETHCTPSNKCKYGDVWISGRTSGSQSTQPITAIECNGSYCDNKRATFRTDMAARTYGGNWWSAEFSEEGAAGAHCPTNHVVTEVQCFKSHCDNLKIKCNRLQNETVQSKSTIPWVSEEQGLATCGNGVVTGIECRGSKCDDIRLTCGFLSEESTLPYARQAGGEVFSVFQQDPLCEGRAPFREGHYIQLWNPSAKRFIRSNPVSILGAYIVDSSAVREDGSIPSEWQWEYLKVVVPRGKDHPGQLALWSPRTQRFVRMTGVGVMQGPRNEMAWINDTEGTLFEPVDGGDGTYAFYNHRYKRFLKMESNGTMTRSPTSGDGTLPAHWNKERFRINNPSCANGTITGDYGKNCVSLYLTRDTDEATITDNQFSELIWGDTKTRSQGLSGRFVLGVLEGRLPLAVWGENGRMRLQVLTAGTQGEAVWKDVEGHTGSKTPYRANREAVTDSLHVTEIIYGIRVRMATYTSTASGFYGRLSICQAPDVWRWVPQEMGELSQALCPYGNCWTGPTCHERLDGEKGAYRRQGTQPKAQCRNGSYGAGCGDDHDCLPIVGGRSVCVKNACQDGSLGSLCERDSDCLSPATCHYAGVAGDEKYSKCQIDGAGWRGCAEWASDGNPDCWLGRMSGAAYNVYYTGKGYRYVRTDLNSIFF